MGISFWQIAIIVVVALLLFGGAGKIPRLMRDLGGGINAFKRGLKEDKGTEAGDEEVAKTLEGQSAETPTQTTSSVQEPDSKKAASG